MIATQTKMTRRELVIDLGFPGGWWKISASDCSPRTDSRSLKSDFWKAVKALFTAAGTDRSKSSAFNAGFWVFF